MKIYLVGFMGCGKTTTGKQLARNLGYRFFDLDFYLVKKHEKTVPEIFRQYGENGFRNLEREALLDTFKMDNAIISTGGGTPCFFDNMQQINKNGISIYLEADVNTLVKRLYYSNNPRPLVVGKSKKELSNFVFETLQKREHFYNQAYFSIDNQEVDIKELADIIRSL